VYTIVLAGDIYTYCVTKIVCHNFLHIVCCILEIIFSVQSEVGPFLNCIIDLAPWHHLHDIMEF